MPAKECGHCGNRAPYIRGAYRYCFACLKVRREALGQLRNQGGQVGTAGGTWWCWDRAGTVLVAGMPSRDAALHALAFQVDA